MKQILFIIIAICLLAMSWEQTKPRHISSPRQVEVSYEKNGYVQIIVGDGLLEKHVYISKITIDSCEYLMSLHDRSMSMTHKGNCNHCKKSK